MAGAGKICTARAMRCSAASSSLVADDDSTQVQQGGGSDKTRGEWALAWVQQSSHVLSYVPSY